MIENSTRIKVYNRDNGMVSYSIPEMNNLTRIFQAYEIKEIPFEELKSLSYQMGGLVLLKEYLVVQNEEAIQELIGNVEPEYFYTKAEIRRLLEEGTTDQLLDCLDFAPEGVRELVKEIAVGIELNDMRKRDIIQEKLGFNVTNAININKISKEDEDVAEAAGGKQRRAATPAVPTTPSAPVRKTEPPKYNVVKK